MNRRIADAFRALIRAAFGVELPMFQLPLRAPAISTGDLELDPLVSFLRVWFAREIEAGLTLVIEDHAKVHTFCLEGSYADYIDGLLKEACEQAPAEMTSKLRRLEPGVACGLARARAIPPVALDER
jgi:hypothetical protein